MSGDIRALYPRASLSLTDLQFLEKTFGEHLIDVLLIPLPSPLTEEARMEILEIEDSLQQLENLKAYHSPLKAFNELNLPLRLLSTDKTWGRFILEIPANLSESEQRELNAAINALRPEQSVRTGSFFASQVATSTLERESQFRAPLCLLTIFALLLFWTRRLGEVVKIILPPVFTVLVIAAALSALDFSLGPIAQLCFPLLLALGTSYSAYIASRLMSDRSGSHLPKGVWGSVLLAALTTIIGFLSLLIIDCKGVDDFALIMTAGTVVSAALSLLLIPQFLLRSGLADKQVVSKRRFSKSILAVVTALMVIFSLGAQSLHVDTVPLDFFPAGSQERSSIEKAELVFPGSHVTSIGLVLTTELDDNQLQNLATLENRLRDLPGVVNVFGAPEFAAFSRELEKRELQNDTFVERFGPPAITSRDKRATRIIVENDLDGRRLLELNAALRKVVAEAGLSLERFAISSRELVISEQSDSLTRGLLESVASALVVVGLLLAVTFRSPLIGLIGLLPSILPIIGIFGALGYFYSTVNLGAAIVAGCALGMISDFTFHLFTGFRMGDDSLEERADELSVPFFMTGSTLILGFAPTVLSPVAPVRAFGLLLGAAIALGIYFNLALLPVVVRILRKR